MAVNIPTPPGGRTAPGGETPPGGEGVPGGRGAPGGTTTPTAPLGRPPRITLRPLRKRGQQKTVQKVKITPDRGAQLRAALTPKQRQEQIKAHVKETMPQFKPAETGKEVPPQTAGMGQKGQAHKTETRAQHKAARQTTRTKVNTRHEELREEGLAYAKAARETHQKSLSDTEKYLASTNPYGETKMPEDRPSYGMNPETIKGETLKEYDDRYAAAVDAYNAAPPESQYPMSFCYGPIVLPGLGQITSTTISQQSSSLIIENQSLFDVLFSVQVAQPQALTQAQVNAIVNAGGSITTGGWDLHIGPRNFGVLELNAGDLTQSPAGGYWSGTVWILQASLPNVQTTAGSFVSDPGPNIWITAYGPGEKLPDPGIASLGYFLASQERQVSVPVTPVFQALVNQITATAAFTWLQFAGPFPIGNFPFSNAATTAGIATPGQFFILMYSLLATMVNLSGVAGTAESQSVQIRIACLDSTSALVGSALLFNDYFAHQALQSRSETVHNPANPQAVPLTVVAGAGPPYSLSAQIQVFGMSGGGGTNIKAMDINMFFDITPLIVPGPSGGLAGTLQGQTYKGFVY